MRMLNIMCVINATMYHQLLQIDILIYRNLSMKWP